MKTNKFILALLITFSAVATTVAQEVQWGVKAGYNLSSLSGSPEGVDVSYRSGFHAGVLAEFGLSEKFSVQPELLYSTEGASSSYDFEESGFTVSSSEELKLGYLNLPIMAKYFVIPALSIQAGPQLGYLLSAESDYEYSTSMAGEDFAESGTDDFTDEANRLSFGLNFGLGYDFTNNFFVQARYHLGLTSLVDTEGSDEEPEFELDDIRNSGFQFSVGYKF